MTRLTGNGNGGGVTWHVVASGACALLVALVLGLFWSAQEASSKHEARTHENTAILRERSVMIRQASEASKANAAKLSQVDQRVRNIERKQDHHGYMLESIYEKEIGRAAPEHSSSPATSE